MSKTSTRREPLWEGVARELRRELKDRQFIRGDLFYPLKETAERFAVSLITAKRAYAELEQEGWVKRHRGKGTIVLKQGEAVEIGVFLPENVPYDALGRYIMLELYIGLTEAAEEVGAELHKFSNPQIYLSGPRKHNAFIIIQDLDEFIQDPHVAALQDGSTHTVVLHAHSPKPHCSSVGSDFRQGAVLATEHLLSLGHRRIGQLGSLITSPWHTGRFEGYVQALNQAGLELDWRLVKESDATRESDLEALNQLFALPEPPTAIFATNDTRAFHAIEFCAARGLRVPEDISVVGFDNVPECAMSTPPLTSVDTRFRVLSHEAIYLLIDLINGRNRHRNLLVEPELVLRASSAPRD